MKSDILKIINSYAQEVSVKSAILAEEEIAGQWITPKQKEWIWSGNFDGLADELQVYADQQAKAAKVELFNDILNFLNSIDGGEYAVAMLNLKFKVRRLK